MAAGLCRRLNGLPLAIELASSRLSTLTPAELLDRLDDRFQLLTCGARQGQATHRTLRRVMDWSYQLCTRLGPFHAPTQRAEHIGREVLGEQDYPRAFAEGSGSDPDQGLAYQRVLAMALGQPPWKRASRPAKPRPPAATTGGLTRRELEVAALVARGWSNPKIARHLVLSDRTVQSHVLNILRKRGLRNREELAVWYARHIDS